MREIIFRGKKHDGTWAYGSLIKAGTYCCILEAEENVHPMYYPYLDDDIGTFDGEATPVNPETVGQYTGIVDKNGTKIFEGDIIDDSCDGELYLVEFTHGMFKLSNYHMGYSTPFPPSNYFHHKIAGNIYDNPEMVIEE